MIHISILGFLFQGFFGFLGCFFWSRVFEEKFKVFFEKTLISNYLGPAKITPISLKIFKGNFFLKIRHVHIFANILKEKWETLGKRNKIELRRSKTLSHASGKLLPNSTVLGFTKGFWQLGQRMLLDSPH